MFLLIICFIHNVPTQKNKNKIKEKKESWKSLEDMQASKVLQTSAPLMTNLFRKFKP